MTELEKARAHLRICQEALFRERRSYGPASEAYYSDRVLAALSWVWDAQERQERPSLWLADDYRPLLVTSISGRLAVGDKVILPGGRESEIIGGTPGIFERTK